MCVKILAAHSDQNNNYEIAMNGYQARKNKRNKKSYKKHNKKRNKETKRNVAK